MPVEVSKDSVYITPMVDTCQRASRSRAFAATLGGIALTLVAAVSNAQNGPPEMPLFEANAPQIGEPLPDLVIHDDMGNPVNLRELADENYKVLVLGCLT